MSDVFGLDDVLRRFSDVVDDIERDVIRGTKDAGDHVLEKTIQVTPMSPLGSGTSGDLRQSGKNIIEIHQNYVDAVISFGDGQVDYALAVHEMPNDTNWTEPGTGNKYLEKTIREQSRMIKSIIARRVDL